MYAFSPSSVNIISKVQQWVNASPSPRADTHDTVSQDYGNASPPAHHGNVSPNGYQGNDTPPIDIGGLGDEIKDEYDNFLNVSTMC